MIRGDLERRRRCLVSVPHFSDVSFADPLVLGSLLVADEFNAIRRFRLVSHSLRTDAALFPAPDKPILSHLNRSPFQR